MKAKQRDKDSLLNKFPDFRIIIETTGSTNYQGTEYNGSIISSFKEIAFVCEKKNFIYVIPWSDINSISTKKTFITNNIYLTYDNSSKNLTFKLTNVESVIAIEVLSQAINEHEKILKTQENYIKELENEKEQNRLEIFSQNDSQENDFEIEKYDEEPIYKNKPLDLTYTKARKIDNSFVVLDFETTGIDYKTNEFFQYGVVVFENGMIVNEYSKYFKPNKKLGKTVMKKTGITNEFLEDKPSIHKDDLVELYELLKGNTIVAHNAPFDMKYLIKYLHNFNVEHDKFRVFDTLPASRRLIHETPNHKLETLKNHFNLDDGDSHEAINDARATGKLALLLIERMQFSG
ncbi:PolC-type DNA polymerase III [Staphylococcus schleiferi]|uniref:3'-5' exonuclease n=1 Tax=Staphylococcus schleiferi TaxID=1295 RepID=UPI0021D01175|nr:3'-5' exonuclease [Staphylococcus schleiferi]UXR54526.1 3'-5' exonuclease [Staphylococcus schleiferi]UXR56833.1 3'-5' exonuclease [Staphylococcus schleiferi]UXR59117.1 3'-5' exonuclease [Staphylococcus schleiferi]UXR61432.1 3'-5' exonuclease [Staphylococcus schleiferi]